MTNDFNPFPEDIVRSSEGLGNEIHNSRHCKCKRRRLKYDFEYYYVYYRKCVCRKYRNRFGAFKSTVENELLPKNHINIDGVDIHANAHCHYEYQDFRYSRKRKFLLYCHCDE